MQQRQLRLGDILDDYCPRERRVTNHAIVAMVGNDVKQTRCTTCDTEHEYKHARVPRQRRKGDAPAALYAQVAAGAPKRVVHEGMRNGAPPSDEAESESVDQSAIESTPIPTVEAPVESGAAMTTRDADPSVPEEEKSDTDRIDVDQIDVERDDEKDEGPIHRRLIRASLPRPEGQQPPGRPIPEFTIRQPGGGRPNRFRPRHQRGGQGHQGHQFHGNRSNGSMGGSGGSSRGSRPGGGRPGMPKRHGGPHGRKRSK
jgi:hypothetical protein